MRRARGSPIISIGLIDGPVDLEHPELAGRPLRYVGHVDRRCRDAAGAACHHGTQVALMLSGERGPAAAAICPECPLLIRPIFSEADADSGHPPRASAGDLADAIFDCVGAGARVLNISAGLLPSIRVERKLEDALHHAAVRDVLVVAAAGNQATVASSAITRHRAVISVAACDLHGVPLQRSNLGGSVGRAGLLAPGASVTGAIAGTSAAAPFVTGALALLWSLFPEARTADIRLAAIHAASASGPRRSVAPPLLNAWGAFQSMQTAALGRIAS